MTIDRSKLPRWLTDRDQPLIMSTPDWRERQAELMALPKWSIEPNYEVRQALERIEAAETHKVKLTQKQVDALKKHLEVDPILWCHYFTWYQRRDPPRVWVRGQLTPGQILVAWNFALDWDAGRPGRDCLLKARRQGFSLVTTAIIGWIVFFHPNIGALQASFDKDTSKVLHRYLKGMYERLHDGLRPAKEYSSKQEITLREPNEKKRAEGEFGLESYAQSGTVGADYLGSGSDVQIAHCDEAGKWHTVCDADVQYDSLTNTIPESAQSWITVTSTAHGAKTWFHQFWLESAAAGKKGWNGFRAIFVPWFFDPRNSLPAPRDADGELMVEWSGDAEGEWGNELQLIERYGLDENQLWWRRTFIQKQKARNGDPSTKVAIFKQEYPSTPEEAWLYASGLFIKPSVIADLMTRAEKVGPPKWQGRMWAMRERGASLSFQQWAHQEGGGPLRIWRWPERGKAYMVGTDVSYGEAVDASCIRVYEWQPTKAWVAAEWFGLIAPDDVAHFKWRLGHFYNTAFLNWERTGPGTNIAGHLAKAPRTAPGTIYPHGQLYRRIDPAAVKAKFTSAFGVETGGNQGRIKQALLADWVEYAVKDQIQLLPEDVLEASELQVDDRGKVRTHGFDRFMATVIVVASYRQYNPPQAVIDALGPKQQLQPGTVAWADKMVEEGLRGPPGGSWEEEL